MSGWTPYPDNVVSLDERFAPAPVIRLRAKTGPAEEKAYVRRGAGSRPEAPQGGGVKHAFYVGLGFRRHMERYRWGRGRSLTVVTKCGRLVRASDIHPSPRDADCAVCIRAAAAVTERGIVAISRSEASELADPASRGFSAADKGAPVPRSVTAFDVDGLCRHVREVYGPDYWRPDAA